MNVDDLNIFLLYILIKEKIEVLNNVINKVDLITTNWT